MSNPCVPGKRVFRYTWVTPPLLVTSNQAELFITLAAQPSAFSLRHGKPVYSEVLIPRGLINDRALNRDLAFFCEQVNQASPHLPDGRLLSFTIHSTRCVLAAQKAARIT